MVLQHTTAYQQRQKKLFGRPEGSHTQNRRTAHAFTRRRNVKRKQTTIEAYFTFYSARTERENGYEKGALKGARWGSRAGARWPAAAESDTFMTHTEDYGCSSERSSLFCCKWTRHIGDTHLARMVLPWCGRDELDGGRCGAGRISESTRAPGGGQSGMRGPERRVRVSAQGKEP